MCEICRGVGLLDQLDGWPAARARTIPCPAHCPAGIRTILHFTETDWQWRSAADPLDAGDVSRLVILCLTNAIQPASGPDAPSVAAFDRTGARSPDDSH